MIAGSECVKHALLSLASAYVLDFIHSEQLRERANYHYKRAVDLLGHALRDPEAHEVGKEDGIVSAIILLLSDDVSHFFFLTSSCPIHFHNTTLPFTSRVTVTNHE